MKKAFKIIGIILLAIVIIIITFILSGYIYLNSKLSKMQQVNIDENNFADEILPEVYTNLEPNEVISLAPTMLTYKMSESIGWPYRTREITTDRWYGVLVTLKENVKQLHEEIFGEVGYIPSKTVQKISRDIINDTGYDN